MLDRRERLVHLIQPKNRHLQLNRQTRRDLENVAKLTRTTARSTLEDMPRSFHAALRSFPRTFCALLLVIAALPIAAQELPRDALTRPAPPAFQHAPGPVPSHRFWAAKNWFATNLTSTGPYTMFPEPLAVQTTPHGLLIGYSPHLTVSKDFFIHPVQMDLTVGVGGLNTDKVLVAAYTDRMVDFDFGPLRTRIGRGMPFVYAEAKSARITVTFASAATIFVDQHHLLGVSIGGNAYGLFCPAGGHWEHTDTVFTCHAPGGKHYLSVALLPSADSFNDFARAAFVFPIDTRVSWTYDRETSRVTSTFDVLTERKEGSAEQEPAAPEPAADTNFIQALYLHQYTALEDPTAATPETYTSARGPMHVLLGRRFSTIDTFHGVLPFLPPPATLDRQEERIRLQQVADEPDHFTQPDTYNQGKRLNRLAQLLPLAGIDGDTAANNRFASALRSQLALWSAPGERSLHRFVYDPAWGTLIGYPASFGSNTQLNDHHFHYGYWIGSAAMLGLYDPTWLRKPENTDFVQALIGDIATLSTGDPRYPALRCFDAYAGHSWASGQAPFGDGENQESTSEAINAWAAIVLYAAETGDLKLRDAAIWMYTLETTAAIDYWFNDGPASTFPGGFERTQISNLFDGKADTATWFGNAPEFEHGIQFLPFSGASLYLGRDDAYVRRNLAEITHANAGMIRKNTEFWPDLMELYQAFDDPQKALGSWRSTRFVFDGESKAHEFAWLSSMAAYGHVDATVLANTPFYSVFRNPAGQATHIAFNPEANPIDVRFTDAVTLHVPAHAMAVNHRIIALPQ
jgi:endoglucanase Acf2